MKLKCLSVAVLCAASLLAVSCSWDDGHYGVYGYAGSSAWNSAWYDSSGYPIYGYCNGRPVYGYTAAGGAIFSLAALTAGCHVPNWGPAPWYRGTYRYVPYVVRSARPPHFPTGHNPGVRPPRPANRHDNDLVFKQHQQHWNNISHGRPGAGKPGAGKPGVGKPGVGKPGSPTHHNDWNKRPGMTKPGAGNLPGRPNFGNSNRPSRPSFGSSNRPSSPSFGSSGRPSRPSAGSSSRPSGPSAGSSGRPSAPGGAPQPR